MREILPRATVLTPNLPEARVLWPGERADGEQSEEREARGARSRACSRSGPRAVVLTGGHRARLVDLFLERGDDGRGREMRASATRDGAAHGSGCTHSAVLAAQLALGRSPLQAARTARALAGEAVANGLRDIGAGAGPVDVIGLGRMRSS